MNTTEQWLKGQETQRIEQAARAKPAFFDHFDEYVTQYPDGEHWRHMVDGKVLIATYEGQSCLEGDYYIVLIRRLQNWRRERGKTIREDSFSYEVVINDGDDGYMSKWVDDRGVGMWEIGNLKLLAPFYYGDLKSFGYRFD